MNKGSKLYSVVRNKCPRCQEGDFFVTGNSYDLKNFSKMHSHCQVCGESFEPEPGYYFGGMYVSYAINVAIMVALWVGTDLLFKGGIDIWLLVLLSIVAGISLTPITFRWSRLIWINIFVKYDPEIAARKFSGKAVTSQLP